VERVLSPRTKLVALTAASNLYGSKPNIPEIAKRVHEVGAIFFVDAVAYAPYELVDFPALGADYLVCSPYKFFGPHLGVLAARPAALERLAPRKLLPSPDSVPERFEQGTLPYELLAGVSATADFLAGFSSARSRRERLEGFYAAAGAHEGALAGQIVAGRGQIPGARRISGAAPPTPPGLCTRGGAGGQDGCGPRTMPRRPQDRRARAPHPDGAVHRRGPDRHRGREFPGRAGYRRLRGNVLCSRGGGTGASGGRRNPGEPRALHVRGRRRSAPRRGPRDRYSVTSTMPIAPRSASVITWLTIG